VSSSAEVVRHNRKGLATAIAVNGHNGMVRELSVALETSAGCADQAREG